MSANNALIMNNKIKVAPVWNGDNVSTGSADLSYHECSTTSTMNILDSLFDQSTNELLQQTIRWMFWSPQRLVKDDVFLAPLITAQVDIKQVDDNTNNIPTPCLSPVTSPSDFLYNHEPLFDGIDYGQTMPLSDHLEEEQDPVVSPNKKFSMIKHDNDLDWTALLNQFDIINHHEDDHSILPPTPCTLVEDDNEHSPLSLHDTEEDTDDDGYYSEQEDETIKAPHLVTNKTISPFVPNKTKRKIITSETNQSKKLKATHPTTLFVNLTQSGIDWCRYCGTTEGVNWRPGPWGKRTLCNKHGCDYKGYGLASRLPRLDLSAFAKEKLEDRKRPIVQQFCVICQCPEKSQENKLVPCEGGCSRAYHQNCHSVSKLDSSSWYCSPQCQENKDRNRVVVDLPRKYLPLMHLHRQQRKLLSTKNMDDKTVQKKSSHSKSK